MNDNRNLIIAVALSALVLFGWQYLITAPQLKAEQQRQALLAQQQKKAPAAESVAAPSAPSAANSAPANLSRAQALKLGGARVVIRTPTVDGSLLLKGARFDDLKLKNYHVSVDPKSPNIDLLAPTGSENPYFAEFGWSAADRATAVPGDNTPWKLVSGTTLAPGHPVTLEWDNGHGLIFLRTITVDAQYMFAVTDGVNNQETGKSPSADAPDAGIPLRRRAPVERASDTDYETRELQPQPIGPSPSRSTAPTRRPPTISCPR